MNSLKKPVSTFSPLVGILSLLCCLMAIILGLTGKPIAGLSPAASLLTLTGMAVFFMGIPLTINAFINIRRD